VAKERKGQRLGASHSLKAASDGAVDARQIIGTDVGQFLSLDVSPNGLRGIQLRRISGQAFHPEPPALTAQVFGHEPALVRRQPVPYQSRFLPAEVPFEILEEHDQTFRVVAARSRLKEQAAAPAVPAEPQGGTNGKRFPAESMDQDGRFPPRRPGSPDRGPLGHTAFILEENPGFPAPSFFFTAGHLAVIQYRIASGLRSRACRAGRCRDQSIAPSSFQTWPG